MRFLTLSSLFIVIFSKESGIKKFHLVKLLQDYDITDEPYFNSRKRSLVSCAGQCIDTKSCVSVFYSASSCKGFKFLHPLNHTSLTKMVGTKYYVAYSTSNQHKSINYFEYCNNLASLNYTWNSTYSVCYRYHTEVLLPDQCKEACQSEDSRSRVMLLDSDEMFNFTTAITKENIAGPLYLQGLRLDNNTFVDDEGRQITYFKWDDGEPDTGNYLRTDRNTYLQKTASGSGSYRFICRIY